MPPLDITPTWKLAAFSEDPISKLIFFGAGLALGIGGKTWDPAIKKGLHVTSIIFTAAYVAWEVTEGVLTKQGKLPKEYPMVDGIFDLIWLFFAGVSLGLVMPFSFPKRG